MILNGLRAYSMTAVPQTSRKRGNVLMVTEALARGGAERQMFALTHGLLERGYDVQVFELIGVSPAQASFAGEFVKTGVKLRHPREFSEPIDGDPGNTVLADIEPFGPIFPANVSHLCRALMQSIQEFEPSAVHAWSDLSNVIAGFVSRALRVPRIVLGQRVLPPPNWFDALKSDLYRDAYRQLATEPSVVFVNNSAFSIQEFERWMPIAAGTIKLVRNGFLPSGVILRSRTEAAAYRQRLGLPPDVPVVGTALRFAPEKDPDLWLETAAAIARSRPDVYFLLGGYGHGAIADQLYRRGMDLGLGARLIMPGVITDLGEAFGTLDALLITSRLENVPNILIEAQAAGIPVVGPAVGGVGEAMLDGVTGFVVRDRSAAALAQAVLGILDDAGWRKVAAVEGPKFVAKRFGHDRMVREMIAIYRRGALSGGLLSRLWPTRALAV